MLDGLEAGSSGLASWETAAQYHLVAVALGLIAWLVRPHHLPGAAAGLVLLPYPAVQRQHPQLAGDQGARGGGAGVGGVFFLLGWAALMVTSFKLS